MRGNVTVAIVADDLTGALDAAAPFAERGLATRVALSPETLETTLAAGRGLPEVISVNTASRHMTAQDAALRVAEVAGRLVECQPRVLVKKVDSTLRGQVVAESLMLRQLSQRRLVLAPAVPRQGRQVRGAQVVVEGVPLADTEYARDALSPPPCAPLDEVFASQGQTLGRYCPGKDGGLPEGEWVVDADSDDDMDRLARQLLDSPAAWLPVGAAGLTQALAQALVGAPGRVVLPSCPGVLLAVGSRSPRAQRQVARVMETWPDLTRVAILEGGMNTTDADSLLIVPGEPNQEPIDADIVASLMTDGVAACEAARPGRLLYLSGGDIALAVLVRLSGAFIELMGEWRPGVPLGFVDGDHARPVMTKAGGFGDETLLVELVGMFRSSSKG
ncbi:four-carbon acid sugar kinase family protein [Litchfieldella xinjiangensis]|uniref:four-carbon acid sugar kinase family protein n=1 Tax=Litchfieldella xinjiangensis TaxID=1166948 RepID=UPI0005BC3CC7|nr:four-carbon acid sugar kinase family protein [Halomonas xinjiangensis]